jgi:hypothetical protein
MNANGYAKIELGTLRVVRDNMRNADLSRAIKIAQGHNDEFERKWNEFFAVQRN